MIRLLYIFFVASVITAGDPVSAQVVSPLLIKVKKVLRSDLGKGMRYTAKFKDGITWTDQEGVHTVVRTETGVIASGKGNEAGERDAELYAYHYITKDDSIKLAWKIYDGLKKCPLDVEAEFVNRDILVTDLDKDLKPEIWMIYKTACHGDVSPADMKIIMYEGPVKYAARGTSQVRVSEHGFEGGSYVFDKAFTSGPPSFRQYAKTIWEEHKNGKA